MCSSDLLEITLKIILLSMVSFQSFYLLLRLFIIDKWCLLNLCYCGDVDIKLSTLFKVLDIVTASILFNADSIIR